MSQSGQLRPTVFATQQILVVQLLDHVGGGHKKTGSRFSRRVVLPVRVSLPLGRRPSEIASHLPIGYECFKGPLIDEPFVPNEDGWKQPIFG
jgi:hypothetical protein